jgi:hypothetical protein
MKFMKKTILFLLSIILISFILEPFIKSIEGFKINNDETGIYPISVDKPILNDYPLTNETDINKIQNNSVTDIWKDYPVYSLPSFKQITNNIKNYGSPDNGTCTPAMFCNSLYKKKNNNSQSEITPLPPVNDGAGSRVGYFMSD